MYGGEKFFASTLWPLCKVFVPFVVKEIFHLKIPEARMLQQLYFVFVRVIRGKRINHRGHEGNSTQRAQRRLHLW